ncbi:MAG: terminase [Candidatus Thorarchaeota archaeon]|jgi:hypothetical protein
MGRPSKFDGIDLKQVKALANKGWIDAEMAEFFKVDVSTWNRWKDAHPEFQESLKDWKSEADSKVERCLFERATGYSHPEEKVFNYMGEIITHETVKHYPPDTTAGIFWLKNRDQKNWRDKQEIDHNIKEPMPATHEELQERLAELMSNE